MHFLVQTKPFRDETLESYLLRLTRDNAYTDYHELADIIWQRLVECDHELEGAFPLELKTANLYHASQSSCFRVRAFKLVAQWAALEPLELIRLSWLRSNTQFGHLSALIRDQLLIPRTLLRESHIPVCLSCLKEEGYIPYYWHLKPYKACHKHKMQLQSHCAECGELIDYRASERFSQCNCGAKLKTTAPASEADIAVSEGLSGADAHDLVGKLTWFAYQYGQDQEHASFNEAFIAYFKYWPDNFFAELDEKASRAREKQLRPFNHTKFDSVFGDVIKVSKVAGPNVLRTNIIVDSLLEFFSDLVEKNPKQKHPNIADLLVNSSDAATLIGTTLEQVFRLYQEGQLTCCERLNKNERLQPDRCVFYLRQVVELAQSQGRYVGDFKNQLITPW
ncbi:TniQ family protein [Pseudoalteromonas ruthenica]|uniref:TniQ family protein n=1 Tax=Pseudoalteromonas ruthenica TaxID=151081 RepID=UPI00110BCCF3|nr:TniQ family protein [Pseudoalteromonas ruthenica]TMO85505.1 hypothetical protein CWC12_16675 [Pseudoalteromonas ruthenica]TMP22809.1 hypothetical protein CWC06_13450 [Pseudoalteromonas ruthenica]USN27129.1 TniQ [synthetic construct]